MTGRFQIERAGRDSKGGLMRGVSLQVETSISSDHRSKNMWSVSDISRPTSMIICRDTYITDTLRATHVEREQNIL